MEDQPDEGFFENNNHQYWDINDPDLPVLERQDAIQVDDMYVMTAEEIRQARQRLIAEGAIAEEEVAEEEVEEEPPAYELKFVD